jgi:hypothetical protein
MGCVELCCAAANGVLFFFLSFFSFGPAKSDDVNDTEVGGLNGWRRPRLYRRRRAGRLSKWLIGSVIIHRSGFLCEWML